MDFELSDDQVALAKAIRRRLQDRYPMGVVRAMEQLPGAVDRVCWRELGAAGVFDLRCPTAGAAAGLGITDAGAAAGLGITDAGAAAGLGITEAAVVFEELGRALVPGPLVGAHLAAGLVDGAASGERVVGLVERDAHVLVIEHYDALDAVLALDDDGIWDLGPPTSLGARAIRPPTDPLTPVARVASLPAGTRVAGPETARDWRRIGAVLVSALALGIAEACGDAARAYAAERVQFGRPIGSFQAVKHLLADMLVRTELARAGVYAAAVTLDDPGVGDPARAVSTAKVLAGEAALANAKTSIQVHGGMGFTWEVDAHLYLKRAWVLDTVFGSVDAHCETLAGQL